jgi:hypothetical protein
MAILQPHSLGRSFKRSGEEKLPHLCNCAEHVQVVGYSIMRSLQEFPGTPALIGFSGCASRRFRRTSKDKNYAEHHGDEYRFHAAR